MPYVVIYSSGMLIQIYEISNPIEAQRILGLGVDHVGVLVGNGSFPREIKIEDARPILAAIHRNSKKLVLTLSVDLKEIQIIVDRLQPDILHLGAFPNGISPESVESLKNKFPFLKIMRSIPVGGEESIRIAISYDQIADFLLLDSYRDGDKQIGATGIIHNWKISRAIVNAVRIPVILAGGLGPENVAEAIRQVRPAGVDSKTRTDKDGCHEKDLEKIKNFVEIVRSM
jgi:phosphoribosylanthranilate isomerase